MSLDVRPTKVVFPPPPPTTNKLSPQQRTKLLRSADKLRRILGTTPRLIDADRSDASGKIVSFIMAQYVDPSFS